MEDFNLAARLVRRSNKNKLPMVISSARSTRCHRQAQNFMITLNARTKFLPGLDVEQATSVAGYYNLKLG
jgi:hypothetical protein